MVDGREYANLLAVLPICFSFIEQSLQNNDSVLVHCCFGRSRSSAIIAAFLMVHHNFSFDEAYELLKSKRPTVRINDGFQEQLRLLEEAGMDIFDAHQKFIRENSFESKLVEPASVSVLAHNSMKKENIPKLLSMDLKFGCCQCNSFLFSGSHVVNEEEVPESELIFEAKQDDERSIFPKKLPVKRASKS